MIIVRNEMTLIKTMLTLNVDRGRQRCNLREITIKLNYWRHHSELCKDKLIISLCSSYKSLQTKTRKKYSISFSFSSKKNWQLFETWFYEGVRERERERECLCVCMWVSVCVRERERVCVCQCNVIREIIAPIRFFLQQHQMDFFV